MAKKATKAKIILPDVNKELKELFRILVDNNKETMQKWMDKLAVQEPDKAVLLFKALEEYTDSKAQPVTKTYQKNDDENAALLPLSKIAVEIIHTYPKKSKSKID